MNRTWIAGSILFSTFVAACGASPQQEPMTVATGGASVSGGASATSGGQISGGQASGGQTSAAGGQAVAAGGQATQGGATGVGGRTTGGGPNMVPAAGGAPSGAGGTSASGGRDNSGAGGFVPPVCSDTSLPANAPEMVQGVWKDISPPVQFGAQGNITQGMTSDPCNPATLYVCVVSVTAATSALDGLYRTTNAGTSWTRLGNFENPVKVRVNPRDPKHLYVADGVSGGTNGFWVSKDGGLTWKLPDGFRSLMGELTSDAYHIEPDPTDFNHVLVTFHNPWRAEKYKGNSSIIESFDGGDSWKVHPPINTTWAGGYNVFFLHNPELGIGDSKTWLFGTQGEGYWRTNDAGEHWTKVTPVNMDHGGGTLYYTKDKVLYASGAPDVLRSTDNGATWSSLTPVQFTAFLSVIGDGNSIYTASHWGGKFMTASEKNPTTWAPLGGDPASFSGSGPFEMRFDSANRILYSAHTAAGVWALRVK